MANFYMLKTSFLPFILAYAVIFGCRRVNISPKAKFCFASFKANRISPEGRAEQYHSLRSKEYHLHIKQKRESFTEFRNRVTLSSVFIAGFAFV